MSVKISLLSNDFAYRELKLKMYDVVYEMEHARNCIIVFDDKIRAVAEKKSILLC